MLDLQDIDELDPNTIPRRPDAKQLYGWVFDCLFADWSLYFPALIKLYKKTGGEIFQQKLKPDDISHLPAETIINCSGTGAPVLFDDPVDEQFLLKGHLLHNPDAPVITNSDNEIISYNYTPPASVYADSNGNACDVYYYPRKDGWILGGSRQTGTLKDDNWNQTQDEEESCKIDGIVLPKQIIDLNNEILKYTYNHSLDKPAKLIPFVGFRYIRNKKNGLRLEHETIDSKIVFHNYGHGGAGVTLSWGCALKIAEQIVSQEASSLRQTILREINNIKPVNSPEGFT
jgi:glycine/D-amino acid oxidase-like deaminating enzyme